MAVTGSAGGATPASTELCLTGLAWMGAGDPGDRHTAEGIFWHARVGESSEPWP